MDYVDASASEKERHDTLVKICARANRHEGGKEEKTNELKESSSAGIGSEHFHSIELNANKTAVTCTRQRVNTVVTTKPRLRTVSSERPTLCCVVPHFSSDVLRPICNMFVGSAFDQLSSLPQFHGLLSARYVRTNDTHKRSHTHARVQLSVYAFMPHYIGPLATARAYKSQRKP